MKVAVTGATGFIGRHVLAELAKHSLEVVAVTRQGTASLPECPGVKLVDCDLRSESDGSAEALGNPDVLIHLAWGGLPNYKSIHHFSEELPAHFAFLNRMVSAGLEHLVVAGTCFEYGMQSGALREDMPVFPSNPYGFAKDALRRELQFLQADGSFSLAWARLFYLYGEGQAENSLLPQLRRAVERGDAVFDMSGGEQLRDFLAVEEVARYLVAMALQPEDLGVVNLCSGRPTSVRRLVERWIEENDWQIELNLGHYPYPDYEPMAFWGDRSKLDQYVTEK